MELKKTGPDGGVGGLCAVLIESAERTKPGPVGVLEQGIGQCCQSENREEGELEAGFKELGGISQQIKDCDGCEEIERAALAIEKFRGEEKQVATGGTDDLSAEVTDESVKNCGDGTAGIGLEWPEVHES